MNETTIEISEADEAVQEIMRPCEIQGQRVRFTRAGRTIGILVSWDEYLALRETLELIGDPKTLAAVQKAEGEAARGDLLEVEDLVVE